MKYLLILLVVITNIATADHKPYVPFQPTGHENEIPVESLAFTSYIAFDNDKKIIKRIIVATIRGSRPMTKEEKLTARHGGVKVMNNIPVLNWFIKDIEDDSGSTWKFSGYQNGDVLAKTDTGLIARFNHDVDKINVYITGNANGNTIEMLEYNLELALAMLDDR